MTGYIQEPRLKILVKYQLGHNGSRVPHPILTAYDLFLPLDVPSS